MLGWRLCARCRSCGATAVMSETCSEVTSKTALNRDDSDKEINIQVTVVLEVPHVHHSTVNGHILLWAHNRVTMQERLYWSRIRPREYTSGCEN